MTTARQKLLFASILFLSLLVVAYKFDTFEKQTVLAKEGSEDGKSEDNSSGKSGSSGESESGGSSLQQTSKTENKKDSEGKHEETRGEKENEKKEVKIEQRLPNGVQIKMETEEGKTETKIIKDGVKLEFKLEDGRAVIKVKNEKGEEKELEEAENEVVDLEDAVGVKIKPAENEFEIEQGNVKVKTTFPLSVNVQTKELVVTTPAGTKVVTVLPQQAVDNMLRVGIVNQILQEATPSGTVATETATTMATGGIELTTSPSGELEYKVKGVKNEKFVGLLPVLIPKTVDVSATTGQVLGVQQNFLSRLLDLLSF